MLRAEKCQWPLLGSKDASLQPIRASQGVLQALGFPFGETASVRYNRVEHLFDPFIEGAAMPTPVLNARSPEAAHRPTARHRRGYGPRATPGGPTATGGPAGTPAHQLLAPPATLFPVRGCSVAVGDCKPMNARGVTVSKPEARSGQLTDRGVALVICLLGIVTAAALFVLVTAFLAVSDAPLSSATALLPA